MTVIPTGDEIRPVGSELAGGELPDTNSVMLAAQAEEAGCEAHRSRSCPTSPSRSWPRCGRRRRRSDLVIVIAGSSAGRDDHTAEVVAAVGHARGARRGREARASRRAGRVAGRTPVLGAPGYPVSAALTFDIFAAPLLARLEGAPPPEARAQARLARKLASTMGMDDWVRVRLGRVGGQLVATPLPRGAGVLTSLVRADGLLVVPAGLEGHHAGEEVTVRLLRGVGEIDRTIVATGSHDLVLDLAASRCASAIRGVTLASSNVGSLGGLTALRDGLCHVAGSHLLDPATRRVHPARTSRSCCPGRESRSCGSCTATRASSSRRAIRPASTGIEDVAAPAALRESPARRRHADAARPRARAARHRARGDQGLRREEHTHLAVAAAVAAGRADCGLGVLAAARAFGLDFVPVAKEPYDLVLLNDSLEDELLAPLWSLLESRGSARAVTELGGYDTDRNGPPDPMMSRRCPRASSAC